MEINICFQNKFAYAQISLSRKYIYFRSSKNVLSNRNSATKRTQILRSTFGHSKQPKDIQKGNNDVKINCVKGVNMNQNTSHVDEPKNGTLGKDPEGKLEQGDETPLYKRYH